MYTFLQALVVKWIRFEAKTSEVMRSNPTHHPFFLFQFENILRSKVNFSTSYGRLIDLKSLLGLLLVSFIWLGEKISLKYVGFAHAQTGQAKISDFLFRDRA